MKRLTLGSVILLLLSVLFASSLPAAAANISYTYHFDRTLQPFGAGAVPAATVDAQTLTLRADAIGPIPRQVGAPPVKNMVAVLTNSGNAAAVYMVAPMRGSGVMLRVSLVARNVKGCARCALIVYQGKGKPAGLDGFQKVGPTLAADWMTYTYQAPLLTADPVVAIGILNLDMQKTTQQAAVDDVVITFLDD